MSILRRASRILFVLAFVFSLIPVPLFQFAAPVFAAGPMWTKFPGQLTLNQKLVLDSTVIKDGATYKMWYTYVKLDLGPEEAFNSLKGLNADALFTSLQAYQFDTFLNNLVNLNANQPPVTTLLDAIDGRIGYAESSDGKDWTVINANAVVGSSGGIWTSVGMPTVIKDGATYKMWFTRLDTTLTQSQIQTAFVNLQTPAQRRATLDTVANSTKTVIAYATSPDGITWMVDNPTALVGTGGAVGALNSVAAPAVVKDGGTYKMWYTRLKTAVNGAQLDDILAKVAAGNILMADLLGVINNTSFVIGYATSGDGSTFAVQNNEVLTGGNLLWQSVASPSVIQTGTKYEMWFANGVSNLNQPAMGMALNAIRNLGIPGLWNSLKTKTFVNFLSDLMAINTTPVKTALTGTTGTIGYAISSDGIAWSVRNAIELAGVANTPWATVGAPSVLKTATQTEMWFFRGIDDLTFGNLADVALGNVKNVGYASAPHLTSIAVTPSPATVTKGGAIAFTAMGTYSDGSTMNITNDPGITWSSSNLAKATINATGNAAGVDIGTTVVSATHGIITSNLVALTVVAPTLQSITISPTNQTRPKGRTLQFTATGNYSDGSTANITTLVSWTSSNPAIASISSTGLVTALTVGGPVTITASLSPRTATTNFTVTAAEFDRLVITPDNASVAKGDNIQLTVTEYLSDNTATDGTATAVWGSSNPVIASIRTNPQSTPGRATGETVGGPVTITATVGVNSDTTQLTVTAATLKSIAIDEPVPQVPAGRTRGPLTVTGTMTDNTTAPVTTGITWASLHPAIATISATGVVTGVMQGTATIRATVNGLTDEVQVTVIAPELVSMSLSPANTLIPVGGGNITYTATGTYSNGSTAPLTSGITWSVAPPGIATINASTGVATPVGVGTATITGTHTATGVTANTPLTVTNATLNTVTVTALPNLSVPKGRTRQFTATATYSDTTTGDVTTLATWTSSNMAVATVNAAGVVTAVSQGTSTISATYGGKTGTATVTVIAPELTVIIVNPMEPSVAKGRNQTFTATGMYSDGTTAPLTTGVVWDVSASTPPGAATINAATGVATAQIVGIATIRATVGTISGNTVMTITPPVLVSIVVTGLLNSIPAGGTVQLTATGTYSDATTAPITNEVNWASSNGAVASVSNTGLVTGRSIGAAVITARSDSITSNYFVVTVTTATISSIAVSPVGQVIAKGTTRQFKAIATYTDGSKAELTSGVTWATADVTGVGVATVSGTGLVTGNNKGTANLSATASGQTGTTLITVTDANCTGLTVSVAPPPVAAGKTHQFTVSGTYSDFSTADLTTQVIWSSNNTAVARVNSAGLATSFTNGTAVITATFGAQSDTENFVVGAAELDSVSVTPVNPEVTFISGAPPTVQFRATGVYTDGSVADITTIVNWTSGTPGVATIGLGTGLATTVASGTAVITATHGGTGKTGTSTLKVLADTVAPEVTLTNPKEGMVTSEKNIAVSGRVNDVNAIVSLYLNGVLLAPPLAVDGSGNFSRGVVLNNGNNTIMVKAVDGVGNTGTSGTITVKIDPNKPAISLTSPPVGLLTNNATVTVAGTATNTASVKVITNGVSKSVNVTGGVFTTTVNLAEGANNISVTGYSTGFENNENYLGTSGVRVVKLDTTPPQVAFTAPVNNSILSMAGVLVSGTVDDPGVTSVSIRHNGGAPVIVAVNNGAFNLNATLTNGANALIAVATDAAGNTSPNVTVNVTLDASKPTVILTAPANKLLTNVAGQLVSGTVNDPSITTVNILVNGVAQAVSVAPGGTFSKVVSLPDGASTVEGRAQDNAVPPNVGTSGVINVTVDTQSPALRVGLSDPADSIIITVTSNEALAELPVVKVNTTTVVMTMTDINTWVGVYGSSGSPIAAGDYTVSVVGFDKAGNRATASATFSKEVITVDGVVPTKVVSSGTTLQVETNGAVAGASISVTSHLENPSGNSGPPANAPLGSGAFVEINASPELLNNLKQIYIEVGYELSKLAAGVDESSLKLYLWDVTTGNWKAVADSGVDTVRKVIWGRVTHLSKYGAFGATAPVVTLPAPIPPSPGTTNLPFQVDLAGKFLMLVTAKSDDELVAIAIPQGTVGLTNTGTPLPVITMVKSTAPALPPAGQTAVGLVYEFGPNGSTFKPAVKVTFTYKDAQVPAGADENKIYIGWKDGTGKWNKLADSKADATANTVTATTDHFTPFTLLVPNAPANFTTTKLSISPSEVNVLEKATVSVDVANTGDISGSFDVVLQIDGTTVETQKVTLAGGASQKVTFTIARDKAGTYTVAVGSESGKLTVKAVAPPPPPPKPAAFTTSGLSIAPTTVKAGEAATVSVTVTNTGEQQGTHKVTLKINGIAETTQDVKLAGGASQKVNLTVTKSTPGTYTVTIDSLSGTLTIQAPVQPPTTTPPEKEKPVNWPPIIGGIVGGLVILVLAFWLIRRLRKA